MSQLTVHKDREIILLYLFLKKKTISKKIILMQSVKFICYIGSNGLVSKIIKNYIIIIFLI